MINDWLYGSQESGVRSQKEVEKKKRKFGVLTDINF